MRALIGSVVVADRRVLGAQRDRQDRSAPLIACGPTRVAAIRRDAEIKTRGIARANEFCDAQGKRAVINVGQSSGWHLCSVQTAEVQFVCDDPLPPGPRASPRAILRRAGPARSCRMRRPADWPARMPRGG